MDIKSFFRSRLVAAAAILILVNVWIGCGHPFRKVPTANLDTGEVLQAADAYHPDNRRPSIVFLGSSLVIAPLMQAEANFLHCAIPRMTHRRMEVVEHELARGLATPSEGPQAYCMAVCGGMISDGYLMVKNVLVGEREPNAVVIGVAPRDFQDNLLPAVQATESFRGLATVSDLSDFVYSRKLSFENKVDLLMGRVSPLWRYRSDALVYLQLRGKKILAALIPSMYSEYRVTVNGKRRTVFPEEVCGTPHVYPGAAMDHVSTEATHREYVQRYLPVSQQLVDCEFGYLERLLAICKERGIEVLIVNMPLSEENLNILPVGFYNDYRHRLSEICGRSNVALFDMCRSAYASPSLYADGVHLSSKASGSFLRELCDQMVSSPETTAILTGRSNRIAGMRAIIR